MTRETIMRETNPGPEADDLFQLRVPHARTPEERRNIFPKMLRAFVSADCDAEGGS